VNEANNSLRNFQNWPAGIEYIAIVLLAFGEVGFTRYNDEDLPELFLPQRSFRTGDPRQNLDGNYAQVGRIPRTLDPTKYTAISTRKCQVS